MKTADLFWGLMEELGISPKRLEDLRIHVELEDDEIFLMKSKTIKTKSNPFRWEHRIVFDVCECNLHEPNSIKKIEDFVCRIRDEEK